MMIDNPLDYLIDLGWDSFFQEYYHQQKTPNSIPARIISMDRQNSYQVYCQYGELSSKVSGKIKHQAGTVDDYPAVGDWVIVEPNIDEQKAVINAILPRKSKFSRQVAGGRQRASGGKMKEQVVAANVDTAFIFSGLDGGRSFNPRRIERYLTLAWNSGASPVIILNKADLCPNINAYVENVRSVALGIPVHPISAKEQTGLDTIKDYFTKGKTIAFLGPSGIGKSTLINALLGTDRQKVGDVRENDGRGRHTTSRRELIFFPSGGAIIDTPGMREIQLWADEDDLLSAFPDISVLSEKCRFNDCGHDTEPDCAVKTAIHQGNLDAVRLESYQKLLKEIRYLISRETGSTRSEEKARWKKISQWSKEIRKHRVN